MYLKSKGKNEAGVKRNEKSKDDDRDELIISNEEGGGESIQQVNSDMSTADT